MSTIDLKQDDNKNLLDKFSRVKAIIDSEKKKIQEKESISWGISGFVPTMYSAASFTATLDITKKGVFPTITASSLIKI